MAIDNLGKVKQTIIKSEFRADLKSRLVAILPLLDKNTLISLDDEISRFDTVLIAEKITTLWERFGKILSGLKQHNPTAKDNFLHLFRQTQDFLNEEDKLYILSLVADVRQIAKNTSLFEEKEFKSLVEYEISLFRYLPPEEIKFLLEHHLPFTLPRINLLKELEVAVANQDWITETVSFKTFPDSLLRNEEILGSTARKTINTWIREFINFKSIPISQKQSLDIAEFLVKQVSANSLIQDEKLMLSQILNLFLWLSSPKIDEQELIRYIQQTEEEKLKFYNILYQMDLAGKKTDEPKYVWEVRARSDTVPFSSLPQPQIAKPNIVLKLQMPPAKPWPVIAKKILPPAPRPNRAAELRRSPLPNPPHQGEGREKEARGRETLVVPRKTINESLYRKTLEELARRRTAFVSRTETDQTQTATDKKATSPRPSPPKGGEGAAPANIPIVPRTIGYDQPFSVNEAIYRGDIEKTRNQGGIVKGSEEADQKLNELKKKINPTNTSNPTNNE